MSLEDGDKIYNRHTYAEKWFSLHFYAITSLVIVKGNKSLKKEKIVEFLITHIIFYKYCLTNLYIIYDNSHFIFTFLCVPSYVIERETHFIISQMLKYIKILKLCNLMQLSSISLHIKDFFLNFVWGVLVVQLNCFIHDRLNGTKKKKEYYSLLYSQTLCFYVAEAGMVSCCIVDTDQWVCIARFLHFRC